MLKLAVVDLKPMSTIRVTRTTLLKQGISLDKAIRTFMKWWTMNSSMPTVTRRDIIKMTGSSGIVALAGCLGGGSKQEQDTTESETGSKRKKIGITQHAVGGAWITAFLEAGKWYCQAQGIEYETFLHEQDATTQITQIRQMVNQGYDGIVAVPWNAAVNSAIKEAEKSGIPVFSVNNDIKSEYIKTFTAFGNYNAGKKCAEQMLAALKNQKSSVSTWEVLNVRGGTFYQSNQRTQGFLDTIKKNDTVEVVDTIKTDWSRSQSQQKTLEWLNANGKPHAIYASNMTCGLGVFTALKRQQLVYPKSKDKHIILTQLDGGPEVNPKIADGYIDAAVDQPNYFYIPLAVKQMQQYWKNGEKSLPKPGIKLTTDDITIPPQKHKGVNLWSKPIWAPAQVVEKNKHLQVKTNGITITKKNADAPYLWGNIWG